MIKYPPAGGGGDESAFSATALFLLLVPMGLASHMSSPLDDHNGYAAREGLLMLVSLFAFARLVWLADNGGIFIIKNKLLYGTLIKLGDISYGIYLFHFPVMMFTWWFLVMFVPPILYSGAIRYGIMQFSIAIPLLITICFLSYRFIEYPMNLYGRKLSIKYDNCMSL